MSKYAKAFDPLTQDDFTTSLDGFFNPSSVAIVGATEKAGIGRNVTSNLLTDSLGRFAIYPVNPKRSSVLGQPAYKSLEDCPTVPDLVMVVTPAPTVPNIVSTCVDIRVKAIIIISAGFKEVGEKGAQLEREISEHLKRGNGRTRVIGPNCFGVMRPSLGINTTFASQIALAGNVALLSQSGAILSSTLDWTMTSGVGFSHFISVGSMMDVDWADIIDYLGKEKDTHSILIYMETIGNARKFLSAAREVSLIKPIIVLKAGRTQQAAAAAMSHTGSIAGSDEVLDAAFRRAGVVRVDTISELFNLAEVLALQPIPTGPNLCIVTNAGGPGVLATDKLIQTGGKIGPLSEGKLEELNAVLPADWSHANPIDMIGSATPDIYARTLDIVMKDTTMHGVLVILVPVSVNSPTQTAQVLKAHNRIHEKPLMACYMGGEELQPGRNMLSRSGIPCFSFADDASVMFSRMWEYRRNLESLHETPSLNPMHYYEAPRIFKDVASIIENAQAAGRTIMTETESKKVLSMYHIPCNEMYVATTAEEAVMYAEKIGYPVVIKLHSETITHKSDIGGVLLNRQTKDEVLCAFDIIKNNVAKKVGEADVDKHFLGVSVQPMLSSSAYELLLGSFVDNQFGPVIVFGTGGRMVEIIRDKSISLPPLSTTLAKLMVKDTKAYKALRGFRGEGPVDFDHLYSIIVNFGRLVALHPQIREIDINPLLASADRICAVDARIVLAKKGEHVSRELSIRPFPIEYVKEQTLKDGRKILLRPLRAEDENAIIQLNAELSRESVMGYFFKDIPLVDRITHERMVKICSVDYDRQLSLAVEFLDEAEQSGEGDARNILGVGRFIKVPFRNEARFTVLVKDKYQGLGLGKILIKQVLEVAKNEGIRKLYSITQNPKVCPRCIPLVNFCKSLGFTESEVDGKILIQYKFES